MPQEIYSVYKEEGRSAREEPSCSSPHDGCGSDGSAPGRAAEEAGEPGTGSSVISVICFQNFFGISCRRSSGLMRSSMATVS